jgi:hypothetical protein
MEQSEAFFRVLNRKKYLPVAYKDLIENPYDTLKAIFNFLEVETADNFLKKLSATLERKNREISRIEDQVACKIGGDILMESLNK